MEALADAVGLRALGLGTAVIDILDRQVEFILVALAAAELGAAVGQHSRQPDAVLVVERDHPVVDDLGRGDRCLAVVELGKGELGVGVDEGLLVDPPDALQGADVEGVLRPAIAWALALELAVRLLVGLGLFERGDLRLGEQDAILRHLGLERLQAQLHRGQVVALPDAAHPAGEIDNPRRFTASDTRTWPQAGCSIASATTASSISIGVRFFRIGFLRLISCSASSPPLSYSSLKR